MANVGDKFIIEIGSKYNAGVSNENNCPVNLYKIKGFNSLVFDDQGLRKMKPLNDLNKMIGEAYKDGEKEGYKQGCEETLSLMRKVISMYFNFRYAEFEKIFNIPKSERCSPTMLLDVFNMPQEKLKACIDEYERDFEVGDEIYYTPTNQRMVVFNVEKDTITVIANNGINNTALFYSLKKDECLKTGRKRSLAEFTFKKFKDDINTILADYEN